MNPKRLRLMACYLCATIMSTQLVTAQIKIGKNPSRIARSSIFELESSDQGFLLPRLTDTVQINALQPPDGTLIYLESGLASSTGLYIRQHNRWMLLAPESSPGSITNIVLSPDSLLTIVYQDGRTLVSGLRVVGSKGDKGDRGDTGPAGVNGKDAPLIRQVLIASDSTLRVVLSDGTSLAATGRIIGRDGSQGAAGRGIANAAILPDSTLGIVYTDSSQYHSPVRIVGRDGINGAGIQWRGSLGAPPANPALNWAYYDSIQHKAFIYDGLQWSLLAQDGTAGSSSTNNNTFHGNRPITAAVFTGLNPGTDDLAKWIETVFYPTESPTASLKITYNGVSSGALQLEQMTPGQSLTATLNWSAGRQASTDSLSAVIVNGVSQAFSQPVPGAGVSGSLPVSFPANTNTSFQLQVQSRDNKAATSSAAVNFSWKRYYGFMSGPADGVPLTTVDADILALQQEFGSSRLVTDKQATPTGAQRLVVAYPAQWDSIDSRIIIGGLDQTGAFDKTTRILTNASGGSTLYVIYTMKNNTSGAVRFSIQ